MTHSPKLGKYSHDFAKGRRKLKIQVRLSPGEKNQARSTKAKRGTGVAASHTDLPASTNVSSPVLAASRRRAKQPSRRPAARDLEGDEFPDSDEEDFIVDDDDVAALNDTLDDSDGFESMGMKTGASKNTKKRLGPPITVDEKIHRLNPIHQMVVGNFLQDAKKQSQQVSLP